MSRYTLLCFICVAVAIGACTKKHDTLKPAPTLAIFHTGGNFVGETVNFSSSATGGSFSWSFGDASSSTLPTPAHSYTAAGIYTVTLVHNSTDTATALLAIGSDSTVVAMLPGSRSFHHYSHVSISSLTDTNYVRIDTAMLVTLLNPLTLIIGADTLPFSYTASGVTRFRHDIMIGDGAGHFYPTGSYTDFYYFSANDSISYLNFTHHSAAWSSSEFYWTH